MITRYSAVKTSILLNVLVVNNLTVNVHVHCTVSEYVCIVCTIGCITFGFFSNKKIVKVPMVPLSKTWNLNFFFFLPLPCIALGVRKYTIKQSLKNSTELEFKY